MWNFIPIHNLYAYMMWCLGIGTTLPLPLALHLATKGYKVIFEMVEEYVQLYWEW